MNHNPKHPGYNYSAIKIVLPSGHTFYCNDWCVASMSVPEYLEFQKELIRDHLSQAELSIDVSGHITDLKDLPKSTEVDFKEHEI